MVKVSNLYWTRYVSSGQKKKNLEREGLDSNRGSEGIHVCVFETRLNSELTTDAIDEPVSFLECGWVMKLGDRKGHLTGREGGMRGKREGGYRVSILSVSRDLPFGIPGNVFLPSSPSFVTPGNGMCDRAVGRGSKRQRWYMATSTSHKRRLSVATRLVNPQPAARQTDGFLFGPRVLAE